MASRVFDASVVVKLITLEEGSADARKAFELTDAPLVTDWTMLEVGHALWKRYSRSQATADEVSAAFQILDRLGFDVHSAAEYTSFAFALAVEQRHPIYDCLYVALALAEGAPLVTADARQAELAERIGLEVHYIG
jgi:predicted nucleic acid-binding protein